MGWRGALRSIQAAARQAEREAQRQARARERAHKAWLKEQERAEAEAAVEEQEEWLASLVDAHRDTPPQWNWTDIVASPPPTPPVLTATREAAAREAITSYRPGALSRVLGFAHKRQAQLQARLEHARLLDAEHHARALAEHEARRRDWEEAVELGQGILQREPKACAEAIEAYKEEIGEDVHARSLSVDVLSNLCVVVRLGLHPPDFLPAKKKTLLKTGRLSERAFPKRDLHKLYSDYVSAGSLRVAREIHALLPTPTVFVDATCPLLDPASGHVREQVILSIAFPRETLDSINWTTADPTSCLAYFTHHSGLEKVGDVRPAVSVVPRAGG